MLLFLKVITNLVVLMEWVSVVMINILAFLISYLDFEIWVLLIMFFDIIWFVKIVYC